MAEDKSFVIHDIRIIPQDVPGPNSPDVYSDPLLEVQYRQNIVKFEATLAKHKLRRLILQLPPNTKIREDETITANVLKFLKLHEQDIWHGATDAEKTKYGEDFLERIVQANIGGFIIGELLGRGHYHHRYQDWQGPVQNPAGNVELRGIEIYMRVGKDPGIEGVVFYGIDRDVKIHGQDFYAQHHEKLNAARFLFKGNPAIGAQLLAFLGRNIDAEVNENTLDYYIDDATYAASPFSFADTDDSPDIIFYPQASEWDPKNTSLTNVQYLKQSIQAKKLFKLHFEQVTQRPVRITRSIPVKIIENLES